MSTALAEVQKPQGLALVTIEESVLRGLQNICTDAEGNVAEPREVIAFAQFCAKKGLDPFAKQVYFIKDKRGKVSYQISIDGLRGRAEATGKYRGREGPFFMSKSKPGEWTDYWIEDGPPAACKVGIKREGWDTTWATCRFKSFVGVVSDYTPWGKSPDNQLAKCAEAAGLRVAFPERCGNLYVVEEIGINGDHIVDAEFVDEAPAPAPPQANFKHIDTSSPEPVKRQKKAKADAPAPASPQAEEPAEDIQTKAAGLFGGRILDAAGEDFSKIHDGDKPASVQEINEVWAAFRNTYGRPEAGQTDAQGKANATAKFEQLFPDIKSMRTASKQEVADIWAHLNALTQEAKF